MGTGRSGLPKGIRDITKKVEGFMRWSATAEDGWSYGRDNALQYYAHVYSNADELINSMSPAEINDFESWISGTFMGNAKDTFAQLMDYQQSMVLTYDKYIDKSVFKEGIVVKSLAGNSLLTGSRSDISDTDYKNNIEGSIIKFNMPRSAAAAAEGLTIGHSGKNVEYSFYIPPETKGVGMFIINPHINGAFEETQREVILGRDTYWSPGPRQYNSSRGIWEIPMYYVGRDKHDYSKRK